MPFLYFQIGKPSNTRHPNHSFTMVASSGLVLIMRDEMPSPALEAIAQPQLVFLDERKYLLVLDGILMPYDQELLIVLHQLRHVFPEQREWRIGYHDIRFLEQFDAFLAAEIPIPFQGLHAYLPGIRHMVAVLVAFIHQRNGLLALVLAE